MADHWGHLPMLMFYTNKLSDTTPQFPQRRVFTQKDKCSRDHSIDFHSSRKRLVRDIFKFQISEDVGSITPFVKLRYKDTCVPKGNDFRIRLSPPPPLPRQGHFALEYIQCLA